MNFDTVAIFLNRACPRHCIQCGISDNSVKPLSLDKWKEAFTILKETFKTKFFLVLGTEPLLMKDDLIELVRWYNDNDLFYGFYSTSPQPLFDQYKQRLLDVGLNNWSCGIDYLPEMVGADLITEKKVWEGYKGLQWMAERGVQTFTVTTVNNINLDLVPTIIETIQETIPGAISCLNPIEWKHDEAFDFFSEKEKMKELVILPERHENVIRMVEEVLKLTRRKGYQIQNPDSHLLDFARYYYTLDYRCWGKVGIAIDCDGRFRLCGYNRGSLVREFYVWDLPKRRDEIEMCWRADAMNCKGCHWSYIHVLQDDFNALIPRSTYYQERSNKPIPDVRKYLNKFK